MLGKYVDVALARLSADFNHPEFFKLPYRVDNSRSVETANFRN